MSLDFQQVIGRFVIRARLQGIAQGLLFLTGLGFEDLQLDNYYLCVCEYNTSTWTILL